ncbi:MAG TPA: YtxH domain-containing protein [Candidatus Xenobia bacterium]
MNDRREGLGFVFGLMVGTLVGASIAIILAPASGEETRDILKRSTSDLKNRAADFASDVKEDTGEWVAETRRKVQSAFNRSKGEAEG